MRSAIEDVAAAESLDADLLGETHDFDAWTGTVPPGQRVEAEVHSGREEEEHANVTTRGEKPKHPHPKADEDKISVVSDVTPPPPAATMPPGLNPFTPEWFAQLVGAAASSAASAAASAVASSVRQSAPPPTPSLNPTAPRRLNDRKVSDFWEDRPEFWFQIFDAHLSHFAPSERQCFDALLPLLTPAARNTVHSVIRTPGVSPYSKARDCLLYTSDAADE